MEWVVTTGKSVEEAVDAALDELGVDEQDAEINVLEEPRPGLFGRVRGEARVQARVRPATPRPKIERRDRRRRASAGSPETTGDGADDALGDPKETETGPSKGSKRSAGAVASRAAPRSRSVRTRGATTELDLTDSSGPAAAGGRTTAAEGDGPEKPLTADVITTDAGRSDGSKVRRSPSERSAKQDRAPRPAAARRADQGEGAEDGTTATSAPNPGQLITTGTAAPTGGATMTTVSPQDQAEVMQEFLEGLLDVFDLDGDVSTVDVDVDTVEVRIEGSDLGLLIGPKGATLTAVQDLARSVAQRRLPGPHEGWVRVDVSGYRQRRREALERFARQVAGDVVATGTAKVLEPMTPADRKVVHDVINGIDGVSTSSEGEEPRRRVVVQPAG